MLEAAAGYLRLALDAEWPPNADRNQTKVTFPPLET